MDIVSSVITKTVPASNLIASAKIFLSICSFCFDEVFAVGLSMDNLIC